jgi:hypothetical protein
MMKKLVRTFLAVALVGASLGCTGIGLLQHATTTQTQLTKKNFRIVKTSVRGESSGFSLFMGLVPIVPATYTEAMTALHEAAEIDGKAAALVNVAQDSTQLNLILFTIPTVTITADVVEFLE